ncbi:MAG: acyl-CoA dehydrogenase family protein [Gammaproteobacteria bacterium]|nr:acyl-CoA dehydrogenase family protein [Gammaproteobacteria bacterium]
MSTETSEDLSFQQEVRAWFEAHTPNEIRGNAFMFGSMTPEQNIAWFRKLSERGWAAIHWPKEYGGTDWSQSRKHQFEMIRAETRAPLAYNMGVHLLGPVIYTFGTPEQKRTHLPRILNFDDWWCQGYSEPGAGSDLASLSTRADRSGDEYIVNGSKIWTTYAHLANKIFCLVRTSSEGKKQEGISFLLIDMDDPGIEVRPIRSIDGKHHLNQVFFDDVHVPAENLVGEEGQGWTIAKYLLTHERTNIARIPMSQVELERLKTLGKRAIADGTLLDQENLSLRLAEIEIELNALDFTNTQMLAAVDGGKAPGAESSMLKIRGTQIQQGLAELRLEMGGYLSYPWQEMVADSDQDFREAATGYNFSRASTIYGGSTEVQYNVMAKAILGL